MHRIHRNFLEELKRQMVNLERFLSVLSLFDMTYLMLIVLRYILYDVHSMMMIQIDKEENKIIGVVLIYQLSQKATV